MPKKKDDIQELVLVFQSMYKYYHGWVFDYEYPGFFVYYQMGGDISVYFTPDFNHRGKVSIQIKGSDGDTLQAEEVPYHAPTHNGVPYEQAEAFELFRIVKRFLDAQID